MPTIVIGRSFTVDFGTHVFLLEFHSETQMTWRALGTKVQPAGQQMTVAITRTQLRPDLFMVYWIEESLGTTVVHVQDFENQKVWTNITLPGGKFLNMTGVLRPADGV
jgi:MoaF N-terminal domain